MSHTKGPWEVSDYRHEGVADTEYHFISAGDGICGKPYEGFEISGCMSIEDARLIAAAPTLLTYLKTALVVMGHPDDGFSRMVAELISTIEATEEACTSFAI